MEISFGKRKSISKENVVRESSIELSDPGSLDGLMNDIGDARIVMLGEASHGTHEYYTWRANITKRLIVEKGFDFIAVEGDWPDCYAINRYVKNYKDTPDDAFSVLKKFSRWPTWMWANWEIVAFAEWLRNYNRDTKNRKGFYGLDVYSLWESFQVIIEYLRIEDPATMEIARRALKCFEPYSDDEGRAYARATMMVQPICEDAVLNLLLQVRRKMNTYNMDPEGAMNAEQNAAVLVEAEKYYRTMMHPGPASWNIRDRHMVSTLNRLIQFHGNRSKAVVWEHNTHIGDARATDMASDGMINVGQLVREERHNEGVYSIGFGSYSGTVIAGHDWGDEMQVMEVPPARQGSWEYLLHGLEMKDRIVFMNKSMKRQFADPPIDHRAIGVVYHPRYEHLGNYVPSHIAERYNAFIFIDQTTALHPIQTHTLKNELPETFPFGI